MYGLTLIYVTQILFVCILYIISQTSGLSKNWNFWIIYIYQYTNSKFNHILFIVLQSFYKMITKNKPRQKEDFSNPDEDVDENREELIAENALLMERYVRTL